MLIEKILGIYIYAQVFWSFNVYFNEVLPIDEILKIWMEVGCIKFIFIIK